MVTPVYSGSYLYSSSRILTFTSSLKWLLNCQVFHSRKTPCSTSVSEAFLGVHDLDITFRAILGVHDLVITSSRPSLSERSDTPPSLHIAPLLLLRNFSCGDRRNPLKSRALATVRASEEQLQQPQKSCGAQNPKGLREHIKAL